MTVSLPCGISSEMFFRLCWFAPLIFMALPEDDDRLFVIFAAFLEVAFFATFFMGFLERVCAVFFAVVFLATFFTAAFLAIFFFGTLVI